MPPVTTSVFRKNNHTDCRDPTADSVLKLEWLRASPASAKPVIIKGCNFF